MTQVAETKEYGVEKPIPSLPTFLRWVAESYEAMAKADPDAHPEEVDALLDSAKMARDHLAALERRASDKPSEAVALWVSPETLRLVATWGKDVGTVSSKKTDLCTIPLFTSSEAGSGVKVPTDWVMAPREPTAKMLEAMIQRRVGPTEATVIYQTMLSEAPLFTSSEAGRGCTCHPDDNPPSPCAGKYALSDCLSTLTTQPAESAKSGDGVMIDDAMLARAEAAWRASVAPTCKLMMRDALRAALGDHRND